MMYTQYNERNECIEITKRPFAFISHLFFVSSSSNEIINACRCHCSFGLSCGRRDLPIYREQLHCRVGGPFD